MVYVHIISQGQDEPSSSLQSNPSLHFFFIWIAYSFECKQRELQSDCMLLYSLIWVFVVGHVFSWHGIYLLLSVGKLLDTITFLQQGNGLLRMFCWCFMMANSFKIFSLNTLALVKVCIGPIWFQWVSDSYLIIWLYPKKQ